MRAGLDSLLASFRACKPARLLSASRAVFRHEWRQLVHAPLTVIFQAAFLLALSVAVFLVADFYSTDVAAMDLLWTFLPWVALVLVPALAMRAFLDEPGDRGSEVLLTLPLPLSAVVLGQWLAGSALFIVTLAFTLPFAATVAYLGHPDVGVMVSGYIGAGLLLAMFYAVALVPAALARGHVTAYVLGVLVLLLLMLAGAGEERLADGTLGPRVAQALTLAGPRLSFARLAAGEVTLAAAGYFMIATALALWAARALLDARRYAPLAPGAVLRGIGKGAAAVALALILIALLRELPVAADMTAEREFTLHRETREIARALPDGVTIDLYWSARESKVPAAIRAHARRVRQLVEQIAEQAGGRVRVGTHDPQPDTEAEEAALAAGVRRVPMTSGDSFFLGAVFRHGDRQGTIDYFDVRRDRLLEYDVALALSNLARPRTPRIAVLSPLLAPSNVKEPREGLAFLEDLKRAYDVAIVPHFAETLPEGLDALIVINASVLKGEMLAAIDRHVTAGKGLIVLLDPRQRFNSSGDAVLPAPSAEINDISDLLARYGITFDGSGVVGDARLASPVVAGESRQLSYPFWLRIGAANLSRSHPVTANLNELLFAEAGALVLDPARGASALVTTTAEAGTVPREEFSTSEPEAMAARFKPDGKVRVLAAVVTGPHESAYASPPAAGPKPRDSAPSPAGSAIFVVADSDWIFDPMALQEVKASDRTLARPLNDNVAFLLNMVEVASGDPRLLAIRTRGSLQRPFTRVAALLADAQRRYHDEEARLMGAIAKIDGDIAKVLQVAGVERVEQLPLDIQKRIAELRNRLLPSRRKLRELRAAMRAEVERLGTRITVLNLASGPALAAAFALAVRRLRRRSRRRIAA